MKPHLKLMLAIALTACMPVVAAETATTTSSVNVRSGPDRSLPLVHETDPGQRVGTRCHTDGRLATQAEHAESTDVT